MAAPIIGSIDPSTFAPEEDWFDYTLATSTDVAPMIAAGVEQTEVVEPIPPPIEQEVLEPIYVYQPDPNDPESLWLMLGRKRDGSPLVALDGEQDWSADDDQSQ